MFTMCFVFITWNLLIFKLTSISLKFPDPLSEIAPETCLVMQVGFFLESRNYSVYPRSASSLMSLPDCSILLYIPYVDCETFNCENSYYRMQGSMELSRLLKKNSPSLSAMWCLVRMLIAPRLQLHNLLRSLLRMLLPFDCLVLYNFLKQEPLKNLFHRKPS